MPYSYAQYTGNGSTTQFAITFPYVRKEHVVVLVNFVSTAYTYVNSTTVQLATAPANGVSVQVRRATPLGDVLVDYADGSTLVAADLDTSNLQHLYAQQELDDALKLGVFVSASSGLPTGNGKRITNVADPIDPQDAATKNYVLNNVSIGGVPVNRGGGTNTTSVAVGLSVLGLNVTGIHNTGVGYLSLTSNLSGTRNASYGYAATYSNTTGNYNTAIGASALQNNIIGDDNTAVGQNALFNNLVSENTAIGRSALFANVTGYENTAVGFRSLQNNNNGYRNTAVGHKALYAGNNSNNVAIGAIALTSLVTGSQNTAIGTGALTSLAGGSQPPLGYSNTAIGFDALSNLVSNDGNIAIGSAALGNCLGSYNIGIHSTPPGIANPPVFNVIAHDNRIVMGSTNATNAYIQVAWTVVSDARDKTNLSTIPHGLDFVKQLKPISFQFKKSRELNEPHGPLRYGFLAQDILALEGSDSVIIDSEDPEKLRYNGESLIPVLVQAIQELTAKVEALQNGLQ